MGGYSGRKRNFSRRGHRRRHREFQQDHHTGFNCSLCNKPLKELYSAIACKETGEPLHFDCVIKLLLKTEDIEPNDKICYLGSGSFGVITFRNSTSPMRFLIKKRIKYEEFEEIPEWRNKSAVKVKDPKNRQK